MLLLDKLKEESCCFLESSPAPSQAHLFIRIHFFRGSVYSKLTVIDLASTEEL
jgi:hypothetical protein